LHFSQQHRQTLHWPSQQVATATAQSASALALAAAAWAFFSAESHDRAGEASQPNAATNPTTVIPAADSRGLSLRVITIVNLPAKFAARPVMTPIPKLGMAVNLSLLK
jgi:hypothetical protein